jgi:hypothetical protein
VNDYEDGSTSMATENPMVGDAFMLDSGEDDDDSDEVLYQITVSPSSVCICIVNFPT